MLEGKPLLVVIGGSDTGRTPMIAGLVRAALGDHAVVQTAGVLAHVGEGATPEAQMALEQLGINIRNHRAQAFTSMHRRDGDLLLAVDRGTALVLHSELPHDERVASLSALCDQSDVLDPHRMPLGVWVTTARKLQVQVDEAIPLLRQRLGISTIPGSTTAVASNGDAASAVLTATNEHESDAVAQMCRLLITAETLPMIVNWDRVRHELVQHLRILSSAADNLQSLLPAAVLMIEGTLTHHPTQPTAEVLQHLRQVIERLDAPVDDTALAALGQRLVQQAHSV
jgi:protein-tyrosine-phosphatase